MESTDLTVQILIDIREQAKQQQAELKHELKQGLQDLGQRIDQTNRQLGEVNRRIDQTNRQLVTTETRLAIEISGLRGAQHEDGPALRERVERCERDIEELRQRFG